MKTKAFFNWSGGKDSALALHKILSAGTFDVLTLFTSINKDNMRISMHGVRVELLRQQAESIGIPLSIFELPSNADMTEYTNIMSDKMDELRSMDIKTAVFGDIFLEDIKKYRVEQSAKANMEAIFPLWKIPAKDIMSEFIDLGFKTIVTCVNASYLDKSFLGRVIDNDFLKDLPANVDICGENGEFHTFVFDGPIFKNPINFTIGEKVYKEYDCSNDDTHNSDYVKKSSGFWFCDLIPQIQI